MSLYGGESESSSPSILLYLAILSALGGALGFFVQKRLSNTSDKSEMLKDAALASEHLSQIQPRHAAALEALRDATESTRVQAQQMEAVHKRLDSIVDLHKSRQKHRNTLETDIKTLTKNFSDYKERYRRKVWSEAEGEQLPEIKTVHGKSYLQVTIRKVTAEGIEFTHANGISRLPRSALDQTWHGRFQW